MSPTDATSWWLRTALGDLAVAQALFEIDSLPARGPAQFAHQAAEKALKAAIASTGSVPVRTHDLVFLALRCGPELRRGLGSIDVAVLSAVLSRSRYPHASDPPIDRDDAARWIADAYEIVAVAARHCAVDLESLSAV